MIRRSSESTDLNSFSNDKDKIADAKKTEKEQKAKLKELTSEFKLLYENMEIQNNSFSSKRAFTESLIPSSFEQFDNELQNGNDLSIFEKITWIFFFK